MSRPAPSTLLRLAREPRWLVIAAVVLLFAAAAVLLGRWQWDRTQSILAAERAALEQAIPVQDVFVEADGTEVPAEGIGRPVTVMGSYVAAQQVAVINRQYEGAPGVWIVTGLELADGRSVAVLRGWLPSADAPGAEPPVGEVVVSGVLQPDETFYADAQSPAGTVISIAHQRLSGLWSTQVLPGFVVLQSQEPAVSPAPRPVQPTVETDVPFPLQNFAYAFQWWIFALFALVVYGRWLWLEAARVESVDYGDAS